jgi:hypothetical protein
MIRGNRAERLVLSPANVLRGWAARRKAAAWRWIPEVRRAAADRFERRATIVFDSRDTGEQSLRVGMARIVEERVDVGSFDDAARIHDEDLIRHGGHNAEIMSDQQERRAHVALQVVQKPQDLGLQSRAERRGRLIGHNQSR